MATTVYFRSVRDRAMATLRAPRPGAWIHMEAPSGEEIARAVRQLHVDEALLRDALDPHEVPRVEVAQDITYIFARVPQEHDHIDIATIPVLFAIGPTFLLTVAPQHVTFVDRFTSGAVECYTTQKMKLFIQCFAAIVALYSRRVRLIAKRVRAMSATDIATVRDIGNFVETERVVNDYLGALVPMNRVLRRLIGTEGVRPRMPLHARDEELVADLLIDGEQVEEMCKATLKHLIGLRSAVMALTSTALNRTMRTLTVLTILLTIPTIVASFFGMNVPVPFAHAVHGFTAIVLGTIVLVTLVAITFHRKHWL